MAKAAAKEFERKTILKPSLTVPFKTRMSWPVIEKAENRRIIEEIKQELPKVIKRRLPSKSKKPSGKKGKRDTSNTQGKLSQSDVILIGVNAVTKALEKGPILLVLVCKSASPVNMTHHLISLCAVRDTPGCCVNGLSMTLSEILGIKSVLAVGFRERQNNPLQDLVEFIKDKTPPLVVPWVNIWKNNPLMKQESCTKEGDSEDSSFGVANVDCKEDTSAPICIENKTDEDSENDVDKITRMYDQSESFTGGTVVVANKDSKLRSDILETVKSNTAICQVNRAKKRKIDDDNYSLYDANFIYKEVTIRVKNKKNKDK